MFYKKFTSTMNEQLINFDALESIRQANTRAASYHLKRKGNGNFFIRKDAKSTLGLNAMTGVDLKAGNGNVLFGIRPKDDPKCTRGLLNGSIGTIFTSTKLEEALVGNNLVADKYRFEFVQKYDDADFYKLVPYVGSDSDDDQEDTAQVVEAAPVAEAPVAAPVAEVAPLEEGKVVNIANEYF